MGILLTPDQQQIANENFSAPPVTPDAPTPVGIPADANLSSGNFGAPPAQPTTPQAQPERQTFGQKLAAATQKIQPGSGVGGWARALVGSAVDSLGDAAAVGTVPPGGGALDGIARTMAARSQRIAAAQQQKEQNTRQDAIAASDIERNKATTAVANIQMLHSQKLLHQLDDQEIGKAVEMGNAAVNNLTTAPAPASIVAQGITSDELQAKIADKQIDATKQTAYATGRKQTGENPDGTPIYRTTYTVVDTPATVKLDEKTAAQFSKFTQTQTPWKAGDSVTGTQFNLLSKMAESTQIATAARNKTLVDNELATDQQAQKLETVQIGPEWNKNLAQAKNDPLKALALMQSDPQTAAKYPHLFQDVRTAYGEKNFDELILEREKSAQKQRDQSDSALSKLENDPAEMTGEKAPTAIAMLQSKLNDPNLTAADRPRVVRLISQANTAQTANLAYEASKERGKQVIADGDPNAAGQLLFSGVVAPSQITSGRKSEFAVQAFKAAEDLGKAQGVKWNAAVAEGQFKVASNPQQSVFFRSANSLLDQGGTLDQLAANHAKLQNGKFPVFNTYEDLAKFQAGDPALAGYRQTVLGAADDYAKVMGGGTGTDSARNELVQSFSYGLNKGQMESALSAARAAVKSQRDAAFRNPYLKTMYGDGSQQAQETQQRQQQQAPAGSVTVAHPGGTGAVTFPNQAAADAFAKAVAASKAAAAQRLASHGQPSGVN